MTARARLRAIGADLVALAVALTLALVAMFYLSMVPL